MRKSSVLNIRGHQPNSPDVVPAAEIHLYNVMNKTARWSYLCHLPPLPPHQYNELLVYHMCEMHQRNVTLCVCLSVCVYVFGRGHVYLPSPLFLLLPDRPFVLRHRLCSVYFWGLLQAALGFGCISSPSFAPPISCFSSVSSLLSNSGFCLVFGGGLVERLVLCEQAS